MKRTWMVSLVLIIAMAPLLMAVGGREEPGAVTESSGETVTLSVWADSFFTPKWQGRQGPVLEEIWSDFEDSHNVVLGLELVPYPEFQAKLLTALSAGNAPDVAIADQYWLASMVETGGVESIGDAWPEGDRVDFFPWSVEGVTIDGEIYGIWYTTDVRVLYYRKDILSQHDFSSPPRTWDEMYTAARALKSDEVSGLGMVMAGEGGMMTLLIDYWSLGGRLMDANGKPVFNSGENKEALVQVMEFYKRLYDEGLVPSDSVTFGSENEMNPRIYAGGYAMFCGGSWQIGNIQDNVRPEQAAEWDIAIRPAPPGGQPTSIVGGFALNVLTSDPSKRPSAIEFIKHLSNPINGTRFAAASRGLPVRESAYRNDSFFSTDPYMREYGEALRVGHTRPSSIIYPIISDSIMQALGEYLVGHKSAEEAIADAEANVLNMM